MKIGQSAGKSWAYLFGVYLGDGCVTTQPGRNGKVWPVFRLNTIDEDFAIAVKAALEEVTEYAVSYVRHKVHKPNASDNYSLRCGDPDVCTFFRQETADKTKLPEWIFRAKRDHKLAFIAGLMDSEGFVSVNTKGACFLGFKSTDVWFEDFIRLLNSVGIKVGKIGIEKPLRPHYRTPRRITIKRQSWIDAGAYFMISRKQRRLMNWVAAQLTSETNTRDAA